jgi:hypothetical protein
MPKTSKDSSYILVQIAYLIGFPLALFCILPSYCSYLTISEIIRGIFGILVMSFILVITYKIFKQKPEIRKKLWTLGTTILFICGIVYFFYSNLAVFCPYYGLPPYNESTYYLFIWTSTASIFAILLMGGFYMLYFGRVAKVSSIPLIILAFIIALVILNLVLEFYSALKVPLTSSFFNFNPCLTTSGLDVNGAVTLLYNNKGGILNISIVQKLNCTWSHLAVTYVRDGTPTNPTTYAPNVLFLTTNSTSISPHQTVSASFFINASQLEIIDHTNSCGTEGSIWVCYTNSSSGIFTNSIGFCRIGIGNVSYERVGPFSVGSGPCPWSPWNAS